MRAARASGPRNLTLHDTAQNKVWLDIVQLALDLLAWMPMLALAGKARLWEPRRLRLWLSSPAAQLVGTGRRRPLSYRSLADRRLYVPTRSVTPTEAVEPGAHSTRHSGRRPARPQPPQTKRSADPVGGPPRKIEVRRRCTAIRCSWCSHPRRRRPRRP
jgi:hypothetical protein